MSKEVKHLTWLHFKLCLSCTRLFFFFPLRARTSRMSLEILRSRHGLCPNCKEWGAEGACWNGWNHPVFRCHYGMKAFDLVFRQYMIMVMDTMLFISAVRTGDWLLHLSVLQSFTKYFFAYDRLNYPLHLRRNGSLAKVRPRKLWRIPQWNWVVNLNQVTVFCEVGADNALEHLNRKMNKCQVD